MAAIPPFDRLASSRPSDFLDQTVNVLDHGVVGDGVTDDTLAFQAAIDAAGDGGNVVVPPGLTILITDQIEIPYRGIRVTGPGFEYAARVKGTAKDTKNMIRCGFDDPDKWLMRITGSSVQLVGLHLYMGGNRTGGIGKIGYIDPIDPLKNVHRPGYIAECLVEECGGHGIFLGDDLTSTKDGNNVTVIRDTFIGGHRTKGGKASTGFAVPDGSIGLHCRADVYATNVEVKSDFHFGLVVAGSSPFFCNCRFDLCYVGIKVTKSKQVRFTNVTSSYHHLHQLQLGPDPDDMPSPDASSALIEGQIVSSTFYNPNENPRTVAGLESSALRCYGNDRVSINMRFVGCSFGHPNSLKYLNLDPNEPGYMLYNAIRLSGRARNLVFSACKIGFVDGPHVTFEDFGDQPAEGKIYFADSMFDWDFYKTRVWKDGAEIVDLAEMIDVSDA